MKKTILLFACMLSLSMLNAQVWAPAGQKAKEGINATNSKNFPFMNPTLPLDERIYDLIDRLTIDEKIQWTKSYNSKIERLGISDFAWQGEALHGLGMKRATMFPQSIGLGATWDDALMLRVASAISTEARAKYNNGEGANLSFWSPNINLVRDPRWGRNQETYGEDPHLTSRMGVAFVKGIQGDDPKYLKAISCPKHFMVHNGPEVGKTYENRIVSEIDLLETYKPAFEAVVKEGGAKGIMGAYNMLNWESCVTSKYLTTSLLRDQWGFDGYVVTDCGSLSTASNVQKRVATQEEAVGLSIKAGVDLNCGDQFETHMKAALEKGYLTEAEIDNALYRTIKIKMQLGLFDPQEMCAYSKISPDVIQSDAHKKLALEAAQKSMTLLKNDKTLPITKKVKSIALIGPSVKNSHVLTGNYTGIPDKIYTIYEGIEAKAKEKGITINYAKGTIHGDEDYMELVPKSVLTTPDGKPGLKAEFFYEPDFKKLVKEDIVDEVDYTYEWKSIVDEQRWNANSVKFRGYLTPKISGEYLLSMEGGQGFGLVINNDTIVYRDRDRKGNWQKYQVLKDTYTLKAGEKYKLEVFVNKTQGKNDMHFNWKKPGIDPVNQALEMANKSDIIIFSGGSSNVFEDEQNDREFIGLSNKQQQLLSKLLKTGKPVIMVLVNGSMTALTPEDLKVNAILDAWFPGQAGGLAVADVLFGDYNPAGRTAVTFYKSEKDLPDFRDFSMKNRTYKYFTGTPNFRFGHGLSYTKFKYSNLKVSSESSTNQDLEISVDVTNTGKYDGDEVVQVYVHIKDADMPVPISSLKAFKRIHIKKGKTEKIIFTLKPKDLAYVNRKFEREVKPGDVDIFIGNCSPEVKNKKAIASEKILKSTIKLTGDKIIIE
ncbi:glycoside hydrolase family 3 C-terminal domain-containing protein [Flavivirga rizhaonensis]|uniref:Glucan 1,4-alpha-glucosidase n=1 Tax=Flavivirga rizhaonensis TaxID=2559571 RepID=A0A4S1DSN0_9FLAO|nr:glycoside hydrolase family 3 C-terminal domain-containing protein [Flavivirga rizhaonensis]TGV00981.1 glucan 1,4-alpha-glucosidase [Flavivirga rizhaonensis]